MGNGIWIYSKINGVNELLFEIDANSDVNDIGKMLDQEQFKKHKQFAYALVDGIEIKLFTDQEI